MYKVESITLEDLKEGSEKVLKAVYKECRPQFLNFSRRYHLADEDLVDIYQETFMAFYDNVMNGKISNFSSSISTYIISIGKHKIYDALKKNKKYTIDSDFDFSIYDFKDDLKDTLEIETEDLTVEQRLLYTHYKTLGKKCKELIDLFYYRGFTIKDILNHTDYDNENVIKSAKSRCMKSLKERIFNAEH